MAAMIRTSTLNVRSLPTGWISFSWMVLSSLTCMGRGISPISSRKMVPRSAFLNIPSRLFSVPVKAPFSWPKSSDSSRVSVRAAQLTTTMRRWDRSLAMWMARAKSSFPVPLSPVMRILASDCAAILAVSLTRSMAGLLPIRVEKLFADAIFSLNSLFSIESFRWVMALSKMSFSSSKAWPRLPRVVFSMIRCPGSSSTIRIRPFICSFLQFWLVT